jgi:hypothetical protein
MDLCQAKFGEDLTDMNEYQQEQCAALDQVTEKMESIDAFNNEKVCDEIRSYLEFRRLLDIFQDRHFRQTCTRACFDSQTSVCCSKDGIITFWADHVINAYCSDKEQINTLRKAIRQPVYPNKCIYLSTDGCLWKVRPLGCALFLCDTVQTDVFAAQPSLMEMWEHYKEKAKAYRWPDRPVLFDRLEKAFITAGCRSSLMYLNTSPGLLSVKRKAGIAYKTHKLQST